MNQTDVFVRMLSHWFIAIDKSRVNIHDLMTNRPGAIVRCDGDPDRAMRVWVAPQDEALGLIGGFISEGD